MRKRSGGLCSFLPPLGRVTDQYGPPDVQRSVLGEPGFLDLHPPNVARRTDISRGRWRRRGRGRINGRADVSGAPWCLPEDTSTERQLDRAYPIREEPIVANPLEATGQNMEEKPSEEFDGVEGHRALPIAALVILPSERHLAIGTGEEPPIGDRPSMCIAGQVLEHRLGPGQWRLGIDDPLRLP